MEPGSLLQGENYTGSSTLCSDSITQTKLYDTPMTTLLPPGDSQSKNILRPIGDFHQEILGILTKLFPEGSLRL